MTTISVVVVVAVIVIRPFWYFVTVVLLCSSLSPPLKKLLDLIRGCAIPIPLTNGTSVRRPVFSLDVPRSVAVSGRLILFLPSFVR